MCAGRGGAGRTSARRPGAEPRSRTELAVPGGLRKLRSLSAAERNAGVVFNHVLRRQLAPCVTPLVCVAWVSGCPHGFIPPAAPSSCHLEAAQSLALQEGSQWDPTDTSGLSHLSAGRPTGHRLPCRVPMPPCVTDISRILLPSLVPAPALPGHRSSSSSLSYDAGELEGPALSSDLQSRLPSKLPHVLTQCPLSLLAVDLSPLHHQGPR